VPAKILVPFSRKNQPAGNSLPAKILVTFSLEKSTSGKFIAKTHFSQLIGVNAPEAIQTTCTCI
jgi:hypothetical protein